MKVLIRHRKVVRDAELLVLIKTSETRAAAFILLTNHEKLVQDAWLFRHTITRSKKFGSLDIVFTRETSPKEFLRGADLLG